MAECGLPEQARWFRTERTGPWQRTFPRFHFGPASLGRITFPETGEEREVWLRDLSEGGISFFLPVPPEKGTELIFHLKTRSQQHRLLLAARVIYSTREPDGTWRVGCAFTDQICPETMDAIL